MNDHFWLTQTQLDRIKPYFPLLRIPMKAATDSDGKRPPVPIQNGHFSRGSILAS